MSEFGFCHRCFIKIGTYFIRERITKMQQLRLLAYFWSIWLSVIGDQTLIKTHQVFIVTDFTLNLPPFITVLVALLSTVWLWVRWARREGGAGKRHVWSRVRRPRPQQPGPAGHQRNTRERQQVRRHVWGVGRRVLFHLPLWRFHSVVTTEDAFLKGPCEIPVTYCNHVTLTLTGTSFSHFLPR